MGLTDFRSIFFRYRLLWHSAYYLASKVTVLLPNRLTRATFLCVLLRKQPFQKEQVVQETSPSESVLKTRLQAWGEFVLTAMVRWRWDAEQRLGSADLFLSIASNFCIWLKFWFAFSNYQGSSVEVLPPFYKIFQNSVCEVRGVRERLGEELLRGQLRWLH